MARIGYCDQVPQVLQLDIDTLTHFIYPIYSVYRSYHINRLEL